MIRVLFWIGTRPEAIKLAPLILATRDRKFFQATVVSTGQHSDLVLEALEEFGIQPDYRFERLETASLVENLGLLLDRANQMLDRHKPDWMVVHGDTLSTLAGSLAAFMLKVPIAHVEAGLRSFNNNEPFPEEANRSMVSRIASLNFAPTDLSVSNLINEGIPRSSVFLVGNTIVDSVRLISESKQFRRNSGSTVLVTAHRRENWSKLPELANAITNLAMDFPDIKFLLPLHPNPVVRESFLALKEFSNVEVTTPLKYREFIGALSMARLVITDSGGIQEEVVSLGTRCLVLRDATERPEVLDSGFVSLVEMRSSAIYRAAADALSVEKSLTKVDNPFGDGYASEKILEVLAKGAF